MVHMLCMDLVLLFVHSGSDSTVIQADKMF